MKLMAKTPQLLKCLYLADTTERRDRGWKEAQRQGERQGCFMDNSIILSVISKAQSWWTTHYLYHLHHPPAPLSVTNYPQTCDKHQRHSVMNVMNPDECAEPNCGLLIVGTFQWFCKQFFATMFLLHTEVAKWWWWWG
jgi:hypothetical protein